MPTSLRGRVAVVTGASSGIGWALALALAREGARVGLIARRRELLDRLADQVRSTGAAAAAEAADVCDRGQVDGAIAEIRERLGPIDLMIANAGVGVPTLLDPVNVADVEKTIRVNLFGVVYAVASVLPEMLARGAGHLVAVSSLAGYKGLPGESAYCASKAAVNTYMEGLRIQLAPRGISVTTICPGFVRTPMTDVNQFHMPWLMDADTAARKMLGAIKRRRKVSNFPWQTTLLMKVTHWLPDWALARAMSGYNQAPPVPTDGGQGNGP